MASGQDLTVRMMATYTNLATSDVVLDPLARRYGERHLQTLRSHVGDIVPDEHLGHVRHGHGREW